MYTRTYTVTLWRLKTEVSGGEGERHKCIGWPKDSCGVTGVTEPQVTSGCGQRGPIVNLVVKSVRHQSPGKMYEF